MSLGAIVFPAICVIGVIKHITTPPEKRTKEQNKLFLKFIAGLILMWFAIEYVDPKSHSPDKWIVGLSGLFGFYWSLFSGINSFSSNV